MTPIRLFPIAAGLIFSLLSSSLLAGDRLTVVPDRESGVYQSGESVTWKIELQSDAPAAEATVTCELRRGGLPSGESTTLALKEGKAEYKATRESPGSLLLVVRYRSQEDANEITAYGGAVFEPESIKPSLPPPDDFDEFWKAKLEELAAVPMNLEIKQVDIGDPKIEYFQFTLDNVCGKKIHGQLAKPAGKTNLPAMLQVQWAGVYPLERAWVVSYAAHGWLAVNIQAHDLPIDAPREFYQEQARGPLEDYPGIGNDDRETSYFLPMFLSCRRAVDFITQHSDWNQKALVVHGGSQGGYQAIVTAGLAPAVTAIAANVPAGCDHTGKLAGRAPGWPNWASRTWKGRDEKKMLETARYFDAMNFARRVECPAIIGVGLIDTACPVEGVLATCNAIKGDKKVILMPLADHNGDHKAYQEAFFPFLQKQREREE